jgi:hypothetical protein
LGQKIFVVALDETDTPVFLLAAAPGKKTAVSLALVAGKGYPQVEYVTEKNKVFLFFLQALEHAEELALVTGGFIEVSVTDDNHGKDVKKDDVLFVKPTATNARRFCRTVCTMEVIGFSRCNRS